MPMNTQESGGWRPAAAGIGLKHGHIADLLSMRAGIGFLEIHAENYLVDGGPFHHFLGQVREHYALSLHGVGLSIGSEEPLDPDHLDRLAALLARYQPAVFSEHLAWSSHGGVFFNDLLPVAYDEPTLARVCRHIDRVQERLGQRMLLENPSTYVEFERSSMDEVSFLREVLRSESWRMLRRVRGSDGVAVIDTVKENFADEFFARLESVCAYDEISTIVGVLI